MRKLTLLVALSLVAPCSLALSQALSQPTLTCNVGPLGKTFGQTQWLVYSCNDPSTLIVVSAPGNPASPFYFSFSLEGSSYHLRGEGTGSKPASDAAYSELQALSTSAIRSLVEQTKHVGK
jgi:hypothetical protein